MQRVLEKYQQRGFTVLAINVEPGRRTEIIGIIDLRKSLRDHRASAPSLGIFKK